MILCKCGCGKEIVIKPHHKYYGIPEYIRGHCRRGIISSLKGKPHTPEHSKNQSIAQTGKIKKRGYHSTKLGKKYPQYSGKNSPKYKNPEDRIYPLNKSIRRSPQYKDWEHSVKIIFNFTCQYCQVRGGKLVSHHIKQFADIMKKNNIKSLEEAFKCNELWDLDNGICYCKECHELLKTKGGLL